MKKIILIFFKIFITSMLFYLLSEKVDVYQVIITIKNISPLWIVIAIFLIILQLLLAGLRWYWVSAMLSANIKLKNALSFMFVGNFFGQLLPSSIGGDGMRLYMAYKEDIPLGRASSAILCDRGMGLVMNIILPVMAYFILPIHWDQDFIKLMNGLNIFASIAITGLLFLYFGQDFIIRILKKIRIIRRVANLIHDMHKVVFTHSHTPRLYAISACIQMLSVFIFYSIGRGLHVQMPIESLFIIVPSVLLITVIPLSIAGWGIRESAMVIGLSYIGVSYVQSFAISFTFGILLFLVALPGFPIWVLYKKNKKFSLP